MRILISLILVFIFVSSNVALHQAESAAPDSKTLVAYLKSHGKAPEDYVISKFADHDIVFIGEYHRIKRDVELIHRLIPRLYRAHIYNLGIEFGCSEDQDKVDRLITAKLYDESLARSLIFRQFSGWGYTEYEDLYRKAWELNRSLPKGARKFRVVNLEYRPNWPALKEQMAPADWDKVWWQGDPDRHMAEVIIREFVNKHQKGLIYSGIHHAFTRYHQPVYDFQSKKMLRFNTARMGNLVYDKIMDKAFTIYLHAAWGSNTNIEEVTRPVHGVIDAVMAELGNQAVGFDVKGSPFGNIADNQSYYSLGYANFTLDKFCDGYIFQGRLEDAEGVTVDPLFITDSNLEEAIAYTSNARFRKYVNKPQDLISAMRSDADIKRRFSKLK